MMAIEPGDVFRRVHTRSTLIVVSLDDNIVWMLEENGRIRKGGRMLFEYCVGHNDFRKLP